MTAFGGDTTESSSFVYSKTGSMSQKSRRKHNRCCRKDKLALILPITIVFLHLLDSVISFLDTLRDVLIEKESQNYFLKTGLYFARNTVDLITAVGFAQLAQQVSLRKIK